MLLVPNRSERSEIELTLVWHLERGTNLDSHDGSPADSLVLL